MDPSLEGGCAERGVREVVVGTGVEGFEVIDPEEGVFPVTGSQGGQHVWISVRTRGLGPHVVAQFGIVDVETGFDWSGPLERAAEVEFNSDVGMSEVVGFYGYLKRCGTGCPDASMGRRVKIWAKVQDQCKVPVLGEVETMMW